MSPFWEHSRTFHVTSALNEKADRFHPRDTWEYRDAIKGKQRAPWFTKGDREIDSDFQKLIVELTSKYIVGCDEWSYTSTSFSEEFDRLMNQAHRMGSAKTTTLFAYKERLQWYSLLRKFLQHGAQQDETASIKKWEAVDQHVGTYTDFWNNPEYWDPKTKTLIARTRIVINRILGPSPSYDEVARSGSHGPGAAVGVTYANRFSHRKWASFLNGTTLTSLVDLFPYLQGALWDNRQIRRNICSRNPQKKENFQGLSRGAIMLKHLGPIVADWREVTSNSLFTVPKTTTSRRPACKEPVLNVFLQRGIGVCIRRRLTASGFKLETLDQYHGWLIKHKSAEIGTIDLSSASDTLSLALIRQVIPAGWLNHIERTRCAHTLMPNGKRITLEKVSSMGNGFTFELETLVFIGLVTAALWEQPTSGYLPNGFCSVFGDDIIVAAEHYDIVAETLQDCGFILNREKSHGPTSILRESCGWFSVGNKFFFQLMHVKSCATMRDLVNVHNRVFIQQDFPARGVLLDRLRELIEKHLGRFTDIPLESFMCNSTHYDISAVIYGEQGQPDEKLLQFSPANRVEQPPLSWIAYMLSLQGGRRYSYVKEERFVIRGRVSPHK